MENETKIPLFRRFVIQNFPYIEQDFDALTDYQLISKVVEYLNKVIESQNGLVDDMNDLEIAFNTLKDYVDHYFDNLDVQEEINNKLDQMAEDGTLEEIIGDYLQSNVAWIFDTVADMKLATNLIDGSFAQTLGFHTINDGGGATYYITSSGTADEMTTIAIGSLYAHLVIENEMTPEQFGAYGDNIHDDKASFQKAIDTCGVINCKTGATYSISSAFTLPSNRILNGNNSNIRGTGSYLWVFSGTEVNNIEICGFDIGSVQRSCRLIDCNNVKIHDMTISTTEWGMSLERVTNFVIENINFNQVRTDTFSNKDGIHINGGKHGVIRNIVGTTDDDMICFNTSDFGLGYTGGDILDILVENVITKNSQEHGATDSTYRCFRIGCSDNNIDNIVIRNCVMGCDHDECVYIYKTEDHTTGKLGKITIENCEFTKNHNRNSNIINIGHDFETINIKNCKLIYHGSGTGSFISQETGLTSCGNLIIENVEMYGDQSSDSVSTIRCVSNTDNVIIKNVNITIPSTYRKPVVAFQTGTFKNILIENSNINSSQYFIRASSSAVVENLIVNNITENSGANAFIEINSQCRNIFVSNCKTTSTSGIEITVAQTGTTTISANNYTCEGHIRNLNVGANTANIRVIDGIISNFEPVVAQVGDKIIYTTSSNYSTGTCTPKIYSNSGWLSYTIS